MPDLVALRSANMNINQYPSDSKPTESSSSASALLEFTSLVSPSARGGGSTIPGGGPASSMLGRFEGTKIKTSLANSTEDENPKKKSCQKRSIKRYNNFNIFFMLERQLILYSRGGAVQIRSTPSPKVQLYADLVLPPPCSRYADLPLSPDNWFVELLAGRDHKRQHRKSHGLVPFRDLARIIAKNYKQADYDTKAFVNEVAGRLRRYCDSLEDAEEGMEKRGTTRNMGSEFVALISPKEFDVLNEKAKENVDTKVRPDSHLNGISCFRRSATNDGEVEFSGTRRYEVSQLVDPLLAPPSHSPSSALYDHHRFMNPPASSIMFPPPLPLSYDAVMERLSWELEMAMSARFESERKISILKNHMEVNQARKLSPFGQQQLLQHLLEHEKYQRSQIRFHELQQWNRDNGINEESDHNHDHHLRNYLALHQQGATSFHHHASLQHDPGSPQTVAIPQRLATRNIPLTAHRLPFSDPDSLSSVHRLALIGDKTNATATASSDELTPKYEVNNPAVRDLLVASAAASDGSGFYDKDVCKMLLAAHCLGAKI